jgi:hypothetical protein
MFICMHVAFVFASPSVRFWQVIAHVPHLPLTLFDTLQSLVRTTWLSPTPHWPPGNLEQLPHLFTLVCHSHPCRTAPGRPASDLSKGLQGCRKRVGTVTSSILRAQKDKCRVDRYIHKWHTSTMNLR